MNPKSAKTISDVMKILLAWEEELPANPRKGTKEYSFHDALTRVIYALEVAESELSDKAKLDKEARAEMDYLLPYYDAWVKEKNSK